MTVNPSTIKDAVIVATFFVFLSFDDRAKDKSCVKCYVGRSDVKFL